MLESSDYKFLQQIVLLVAKSDMFFFTASLYNMGKLLDADLLALAGKFIGLSVMHSY